MQSIKFPVGSRPFCIWDEDIREKNIAFIDQVDPEYFEYVAKVHEQYLDGEEKARAAAALRLTFHHALETFFSFLGSAIQSPACIFAWMLKYKPSELRVLLEKINANSGDITALRKYQKDSDRELLSCFKHIKINWYDISQLIHQWGFGDPETDDEVRGCFEKMWFKFARDFVSEKNTKEYNSIKHGFRVKSGGFHIAMAPADESTPNMNDANWHQLGGSEFGMSYYSDAKIKDAPKLKKKDPHFQVMRTMQNWDPSTIVYTIPLISVSIKNIISFLKMYNEVEGPHTFFKPSTLEQFKTPYNIDRVGASTLELRTTISEHEINRIDGKELLAKLKRKDYT